MNRKYLNAVSIFIALFCLTGCATKLSYSAIRPAKYSIPGISKIAFVDFNSVHDNIDSGIFAADSQTVRIAQDVVASHFYGGTPYQTVNLDIEKVIAEGGRTDLKNRYDALIYGRVWWQITPEYLGQYPEKYVLNTVRTYIEHWTPPPNSVAPRGQQTEFRSLLIRMKDEMAQHYYRTRTATMMMSLTIYKLDKDGNIEKVLPLFAHRTISYLKNNGIETGFCGQAGIQFMPSLGYKHALVQFLANKLVDNLKSYSVQITLERNWPFSNSIITELQKGNFQETANLAVTEIYQKTGRRLAEKIPPVAEYPLPEGFSNTPKEEDPITEKDIFKAAKSNEGNIYALAISEEMSGNFEQALATYVYLIQLTPNEEYASGISRCRYIMGLNKKVKYNKKMLNRAVEKSNVN